MIILDSRLLACAEMVKGGFVCDVGTDHGKLAAYLMQSGRCTEAIAADIAKMPLEAAKATFEKENISENISFILSDGLKNIPLEGVTDIVIAGMGGEMIFRILSSDERVKECGAAFILQPMTKTPYLRRMLAENGFETEEERAVRDGRFIYSAMRCRYSGDGSVRKISAAEEYTGRLDIGLPLSREYISLQLKRLEKAASGLAAGSPEKAAELIKTAQSIRKETGI